MDASAVTFRWERGTVSGLRQAPSGARAAVVLAHGAGKDMNDPLLVGVAAGLAHRGIAVVRFNFPYREAGRRAPGSPTEAEACYRAVADRVREDVDRVFLGGKSYGGRIASHIVSAGTRASGLVFLGYPLHPPGKLDRLRDAHLDAIDVPMLFCQGTRDPFARPDLLHAVVGRLGHADLVAVEGGDHSFKVRGRPHDDVIAELVEVAARFVEQHN